MRYTDIICNVCGQPFAEEDDVVVCPVCGTPHHRACWMQTQHCVNEALHEQGFEWKFPEDKDPIKKLDELKRKAHSPTPEFTFKNGETVIECPHCGALNYENDAFCMKCRAPLKENTRADAQNNVPPQGGADAGQGYAYTDPHRLAYDNQRLYGGLEPNVMIDGIPVAEYSDYIGGNAPGKMIRRIAGMERFNRKISFNFAALVFGPIWFFYRKMYKTGAMILILVMLCSAISSVLVTTPAVVKVYHDMFDTIKAVYAGEITVDEYYSRFNEIMTAPASETDSVSRTRIFAGQIVQYAAELVWFSCALVGDRFYRKKIKKDVEESRRACDNMEDYRRMLYTKGGPSASGAVIGVAAALAVFFLSQLPTFILVFTT